MAGGKARSKDGFLPNALRPAAHAAPFYGQPEDFRRLDGVDDRAAADAAGNPIV
jgi:hypothetical protein